MLMQSLQTYFKSKDFLNIYCSHCKLISKVKIFKYLLQSLQNYFKSKDFLNIYCSHCKLISKVKIF